MISLNWVKSVCWEIWSERQQNIGNAFLSSSWVHLLLLSVSERLQHKLVFPGSLLAHESTMHTCLNSAVPGGGILKDLGPWSSDLVELTQEQGPSPFLVLRNLLWFPHPSVFLIWARLREHTKRERQRLAVKEEMAVWRDHAMTRAYHLIVNESLLQSLFDKLSEEWRLSATTVERPGSCVE